ncbi:MAG TPA: tryptophan--tRNA ligase [Patescibacteria group bacterium]|nr:tryptophan--tRNA ligase [Patescibacteria group bacterium]
MDSIQTIVSGIRASGKLHLGNYLGALKQFIDLQNEGHRCFYFIADQHALTTPFEPKELRQNTLDVVATYLALGIKPHKSVFFLQNHVLEHAWLGWLFDCILPLGELERMTQFKDKARQHKENINAGLLTYPALMAADILLYKPTAVPVGEDQTQHVELARTVARKFNSRFGKIFPEPRTFLQRPLRIMSLADPEKKMSKTGDEALLLDDEPKEIMRKLKKAVTASEGGKKSSGVENLFLLLDHFGDQSQIAYFRDAQRQGSLKFSELKQTLAEDIAQYFAEFREQKKALLARPNELAEILAAGAAKAKETARQTIIEVKQKTGLL